MTPAPCSKGFPIDLLVTLRRRDAAVRDRGGATARWRGSRSAPCASAAATRACCRSCSSCIGFVVATIGAGATPASALLAPPAMAVAARAGMPPLLMAIMTGNGALAGTLSPFAPTGIVAHGVMERIGLGGVEWQTFAYNALAHTLVGFGGFLLLGGWKLFRSRRRGAARRGRARERGADGAAALAHGGRHRRADRRRRRLRPERRHGGAHHRDRAVLLRTVDESKAIARMPWGVILMVTGVTVLVALLQETRGPRADHERHREPVDADDDRADRRVRHRARIGLQQHVGRRAAGVSADGARARAAPRRPRPAADRVVDEREPPASSTCRRCRRSARCSSRARRRAADTRKLFNGCSRGVCR